MGQAESRQVRLGMVDVLWPIATHWAVQVDDTWFEVGSNSKQEETASMSILVSHGKKSAVGTGAQVSRFGHVGTTIKSDGEISEWISLWKGRNPKYSFTADNCQKFAREFIDWLTDGTHKPLPKMDAGVGGNRARGPNAWGGVDGGAAYAGSSVANMQGHCGLLNGALTAPNASAAALCGEHGFGAFTEAEVGRMEGGFGPIRAATHLNVNTGIGVRNEGFEVSAGGAGFAVGGNGVWISTPCCTVGIGRL